MPHHRTWLYLAVLLSTGWAACGGCGNRSTQAPKAKEQRLQPLEDRVLALAGKIDTGNQYLSTVMVSVRWQGGGEERCSGVLIHPRLVLTAGHCVCKVSGTLIDGTACAEAAEVTTVRYKPPRETDFDRRGHDGRVQPHRELRVVLDDQGRVVSSHADLALVVLDKPLDEGGLRPAPVAGKEVKVHEMLTIVGYGYDEIAGGHDGNRRFSENRVTVLAGERLLVEQPGHHLYKGDSGGPCLLSTSTGPVLVGVSGRRLGEGAVCTSTYPFREWLHEEIQQADGLR